MGRVEQQEASADLDLSFSWHLRLRTAAVQHSVSTRHCALEPLQKETLSKTTVLRAVRCFVLVSERLKFGQKSKRELER